MTRSRGPALFFPGTSYAQAQHLDVVRMAGTHGSRGDRWRLRDNPERLPLQFMIAAHTPTEQQTHDSRVSSTHTDNSEPLFPAYTPRKGATSE